MTANRSPVAPMDSQGLKSSRMEQFTRALFAMVLIIGAIGLILVPPTPVESLVSGSAAKPQKNQTLAKQTDGKHSHDSVAVKPITRNSTLTSGLRQSGIGTNSTTTIKKSPSGRTQKPTSDRRSDRQLANQAGDTRIPFWNIAHMINSIEQVQQALR